MSTSDLKLNNLLLFSFINPSKLTFQLPYFYLKTKQSSFITIWRKTWLVFKLLSLFEAQTRFIHLTFYNRNKSQQTKKNVCKTALSSFQKKTMADRNTDFLKNEEKPMHTESIYLSGDGDNTL